MVLFSATLTPWNFYAASLGLPDDTAWLDVAPPFKAEQLSVHIARDVSTRYRHRSSSLAPIARLIAAQYDVAPGNYIAFFSSFDYLERAAAELSQRLARSRLASRDGPDGRTLSPPGADSLSEREVTPR